MTRRYPVALIALVAVLTIASFSAGRAYELLLSAHDKGGSISARGSGLLAALPGQAGAGVSDDISLEPFLVFQDVLSRLRQLYFRKIDKAENERLAYGAIRGMLGSLTLDAENKQPDHYTRFMDPEEFGDFQRENQGHLSGIGARLTMEQIDLPKENPKDVPPSLACPVCGSNVAIPSPYRLMVVSPLPNSPAAAAGVAAGDLILKINDESTDGMWIDEAVTLIRGEAGTKVTLLLGRKGAPEPIKAVITRADVEVPSVEWQMLAGNIGYVKLNMFNDQTEPGLDRALAGLEAKHARGLVLDLRDNPGGLLEVCVRVASRFVEKSPVVYIQERGGERKRINTEDDVKTVHYPLVVLVNKGSASASEILAGVIKDYDLGPLVGQKTFGKGLVQTILPVGDGAAVAITTARYYTPKGGDIQTSHGIDPDKAVELPEKAQYLSDQDTQLQAGLDLLKQRIARGH